MSKYIAGSVRCLTSTLKANYIVFSLIIISAAPFFYSCNGDKLSVRTEYVGIESLASFYVDTPDPALNRPPFGQRLIITWSVPREYTSDPDIRLCVTVRFRNREERTQYLKICRMKGTYIFSLLNNDYCQKGGILTYKVLLVKGDAVLEEWQHQLWSKLITFQEYTQ